MKRFALGVTFVFAGIAGAWAADVGGSADHPLLPRYQGSEIVLHEVEQFTDHQLRISPDRTASMELEGKVTRITYRAPQERSVLEVMRNYEAALEAAGFSLLFSCARGQACGDIPATIETGPRQLAIWGGDDNMRYMAARRQSPDGDVYASVYSTRNHSGGPSAGRSMVQLDIVEVKPMESRMAVVDARAMGNDLAAEGRVAIYGILFDFDRDTPRPESEPQLREIAALMTADPGLRVLIVGHTDARGAMDYNRDLSGRRARGVAAALSARFGIDAARLTPVGVGMAAPVASNRTEEGRALNRRVELVDLGG